MDNIQRWRKLSKLQSELLCATVVEPLSDLDHRGVLNVFCVLISKLAPVEDGMSVMMPQSKKRDYTTSPKNCVRQSPAFSANLPTGSWRLNLSPAMVNCWTLNTEGTSAGRGVASSRDSPRRRCRLLSNNSWVPCENSICLHSQNVAGFPKHPERCADWFSHFRQREGKGSIDLVLLQETRVDIGYSSFMDDLYNKTWGVVTNPGRTKWTESEHPRGGVAMQLYP